jgi:hypothetical protein
LVAVDAFGNFQVSGLFGLCAVVVAVSASTRWTVIASAAAVTAAVASGWWHDNLGVDGMVGAAGRVRARLPGGDRGDPAYRTLSRGVR